MPSFQKLFLASKGNPIEYKGHLLVLADLFPTYRCHRFRLTFESRSSKWRQGVALRTTSSFLANQQAIGQFMVLWEDTAPQSVVFEIADHVEHVTINNVWDTGDGVMHAWHNGAAMIAEDILNGRRYQCNDGFADDDFDDIIFKVERTG